VPVFNQV